MKWVGAKQKASAEGGLEREVRREGLEFVFELLIVGEIDENVEDFEGALHGGMELNFLCAIGDKG